MLTRCREGKAPRMNGKGRPRRQDGLALVYTSSITIPYRRILVLTGNGNIIVRCVLGAKAMADGRDGQRAWTNEGGGKTD